MSRSPYDASSAPAHPLSLSRSPRVPRTLDAAVARARAPQTNETPEVDRVLLESLASAVRTLQATVKAQGEEIAKWKRRVTDLEAREDV